MHKGLRMASTPFAIRVAVVTIAAMVLMFGLAFSDAAAGEWKGNIVNESGRVVVENPAEGFKKTSTVEMEELWRLGGDTDDEEEFFGVIADIEVDEDGFVYLLDSQLAEVKIYTSDGEFVRSIGREGEGPGEFRRPSAMFFTDDGNVAVVQMMPGKIVILSKDGDPMGDFPLPEPEDGGFQLIQGAQSAAGNIVLFMARQEFDQTTNMWSRRGFLTQVNKSGEQVAEYATKTNTINMAAAVMNDASWDTFERRWTLGPDGKVYTCESYENYEITVWNADGSKEKMITREFKHRRRPADEKDFVNRLFSHFAKRIPNSEVKVHDMCKDIESIYVRDDGSIWVLNSNGARDAGDGTLGLFDVYNPEGQFVRNVELVGEGDSLDDLYVFVKDRVYVVTSFLQAAMSAQGVEDLYDEDDEADPMAVICYKLDGDVLAAR